jgi:transposase
MIILSPDIAVCHSQILLLQSCSEGDGPKFQNLFLKHQAQGKELKEVKELYQNQTTSYHHVSSELLIAQATIASKDAEIKELLAKLGLNSQNSSLPPSSDKFNVKPKPQPAFPRNPGVKVGGKTGHTGKTLNKVDKPDIVKSHKPEVCAGCGKVHDHEPVKIITTRQEFTMPIPQVVVVEHQKQGWDCGGCNHENIGVFPNNIKAPTQYGSTVKSLIVLLHTNHKMPVGDIQSLLLIRGGISINENTIQKYLEEAYKLLEVEEKHIVDQLRKSDLVHADESGFKTAHLRIWGHVVSNDMFTHIRTHMKRGAKAHESDDFFAQYKGWMIHDCFGTYFAFKNAKHGLCGAHLLRELKAQIEIGRLWAQEMHKLLMEMYVASDYGKGVVGKTAGMKFRSRYKAILKRANKEEPPATRLNKGKLKQTKGRNLHDRLSKHMEAVIAFAFNKEVPFTNNQAERDIRPAKSKIKVMGCFRTEQGAKEYARILSFFSTVTKHGFNPYDEILAVFEGRVPQYRA